MASLMSSVTTPGCEGMCTSVGRVTCRGAEGVWNTGLCFTYRMMPFKGDSFGAGSHARMQLRGLSTAYHMCIGVSVNGKDRLVFKIISSPFAEAD